MCRKLHWALSRVGKARSDILGLQLSVSGKKYDGEGNNESKIQTTNLAKSLPTASSSFRKPTSFTRNSIMLISSILAV